MIPLLIAAVLAASPAGQNPYLDPALQLYNNLEFQEALKILDKAQTWAGNTPEQDVRAALLEGVICAQLGKTERAMSAFKRALALDPGAKLYFAAPPKVVALFRKSKKELGAQETEVTVAPLGGDRPPVKPPEPRPAEVKVEPKPVDPPAEKPPVKVAAVTAPVGHDTSGDVAVQPELGSATPATIFGGVGGLVDVLGRSVGVEVHAGYSFPGLELSGRLRIGPTIGLGAVAAYGLDLGSLTLALGLRGDYYVQASSFGAGPLVTAHVPLNDHLGLFAGASFELFGTRAPFHSAAAVLAGGLEFRL